jgi:hypothetical protein
MWPNDGSTLRHKITNFLLLRRVDSQFRKRGIRFSKFVRVSKKQRAKSLDSLADCHRGKNNREPCGQEYS